MVAEGNIALNGQPTNGRMACIEQWSGHYSEYSNNRSEMGWAASRGTELKRKMKRISETAQTKSCTGLILTSVGQHITRWSKKAARLTDKTR